MLRAVHESTVKTAKEQSDYLPALGLLAVAFPVLLVVPAVAYGGAALADATSGTAKGIGGMVSRWRERRRQAAEAREHERQKAEAELQEKIRIVREVQEQLEEERNRPTEAELLAEVTAEFNARMAVIVTITDIDERDVQEAKSRRAFRLKVQEILGE